MTAQKSTDSFDALWRDYRQATDAHIAELERLCTSAEDEKREDRLWTLREDAADKIASRRAQNVSELARQAEVLAIRANENTPMLFDVAQLCASIMALAEQQGVAGGGQHLQYALKNKIAGGGDGCVADFTVELLNRGLNKNGY